MKRVCFIILVLALCPVFSASGSDVVHPGSAGLACSYEISDLLPRVGDTITIIRTFKNNESYTISGLYLGDNLPQSFQIISGETRLNSTPISTGFESDPVGTLQAGFIPFRWTVDDPYSLATSTTLGPGDSLYMTLQVVCSEAGEFLLEQHSSVGYGNNEPFFVLADQPIDMTVSISTDVDGEAELPESFLTATAYPNPFNAVTSIAYSMGKRENLRIEIYDLLGRKVSDRTIRVQSTHGTVSWDANNVGSGIYLYRLSTSEHTTVGKLVLLK